MAVPDMAEASLCTHSCTGDQARLEARPSATDFELLRAIYERHDADWAGSEDRPTRVFVPINIPAIADDLDRNADMVAGRVRHDLNLDSRWISEHRRAATAGFGEDSDIAYHRGGHNRRASGWSRVVASRDRRRGPVAGGRLLRRPRRQNSLRRLPK